MIDVNLNTTELDPANANLMAQAAKAAYIKKSKQDKSPCEQRILSEMRKHNNGFVSVKGFSTKSAQAIVLEHQAFIVLAFRGTDEVADWLDNLKFRIQGTRVGKFHRGFLNSVNDLWDAIFEHYQILQNSASDTTTNQYRPLFITGHSLGGAMAVVAAAKLIEQGVPFHSVYTFGQPRVAQRSAKDQINAYAHDRIFRFVNNADIVSRVPGPWLGYRHVGLPLYISEEKEIFIGCTFWFRLIDLFDGVWSSLKQLRVDLVYDHNMEHYIDGIETWNLKQ